MASSNRTDIKELSTDQLVSWLETYDIKPFRAVQILQWMYFRQADTFDVMSDLGKDVRHLLSEHFTIGRLDKVRIETSNDGSRKFLFRLKDGACIESVLIPEKDHYTLCVSNQVGCAQGCKFCLTARKGFIRNLTKGEIVAQVRDVQKDLDDPKRLTNIVFMGMGEPLANYTNVLLAVQALTDRKLGLNFSTRRVTISTAGLVHRLSDLGRDTEVSLAVSLNATENRTRTLLMPINRKYPIEALLEACRQYPLRHRRRITFEYILMKGINDSPEDANRLATLLRPIQAKINLIPFNEFEGSGFSRPEEPVIRRFQEILLQNRFTAVIRHSKGQDISAACGQLSGTWNGDA